MFQHKNTPKRGVAVGIHNAVLARLEELQQTNRALQKILANIVRQNKRPLVVDIAPIPGDWVLTMDNAPSMLKDQEAVVLNLISREDYEAQNRQIPTKH